MKPGCASADAGSRSIRIWNRRALLERPVEADSQGVLDSPQLDSLHGNHRPRLAVGKAVDNEVQRHKVFTPQELHRPTET